jgi:hypothetical protein
MGARKTAQPVYEGRYAAEVEKRAYSQRGLNRAIPFDALEYGLSSGVVAYYATN